MVAMYLSVRIPLNASKLNETLVKLVFTTLILILTKKKHEKGRQGLKGEGYLGARK